MTVFPNFEMGDNIVLNGMCRYLSRKHRDIVWVARRAYHSDIARMFSDLPNVLVVDGYDYPEAKTILVTESIRMGFFGSDKVNWREVQWDREFYIQAGVDFDERWDSVAFPVELIPAVSPSDAIVIHDIPERKITIDPADLPVGRHIRIVRRPSFWNWLPEILSARELHCVDSAYLNLAESLYATGHLRNTKLVFHSRPKIRLHNSVPPVLRAPWTIL